MIVIGDANISGTFTHGSDNRLKHNEVDISNAMTTIEKLTPKFYIKTPDIYDSSGNLYGANYDFPANGLPDKCNYECGLIADEVELIPELAKFVHQIQEPDEKGNLDAKELDYNSVFCYLIKAVQELSARVSLLENVG